MKKWLFVFALLLPAALFSQCDERIENHFEGVSYERFLMQTRQRLEKLRVDYRNSPQEQKDSILKKTGLFLTESLMHGGFHYWIGTTWDFNGYTNEPRKGTIACGYFLSTTLKHVGFNLNRYKLAQKGASDEAKYVCGLDHMHTFRSISAADLKQVFSERFPVGLYMVGLANHVGFLYWDATELYFIHSNYGTPYAVVIESFCESEVSESSIYVIGELSTNTELMRKWLENEWISIP